MQIQQNEKPRRRYRIITINENRDFKRGYAKGKSMISPVLVTYICKNYKKKLRVGITSSKKVGNAVKRNRSRRVIRAAYQELLPDLDQNRNMDLIFVARTKTPYVKSNVVRKAMASHLKEAGILK